MTTDSKRDRGQPAGGLPAELQGQIGRRLKAAYSSMLSEPVPERFTQLLEQLEAGSSATRDGAKDGSK